MWKQAMELLPESIRTEAERSVFQHAEEIRLRLGKRPSILRAGKEQAFSELCVDRGMLESVMEKATGASMHAVGQALREGYLSYRGLRLGVCGTAVLEGREVETFRLISSLAIRIPRECREICYPYARQMYRDTYHNTLILSPPGGGKTTALRDMIRYLSGRGYRVGVVDERNELVAMDGTTAHFDLGEHSDFIIGAPKAAAVRILLRAMNPQILAMDEISSECDCELVQNIIGCGVGLLATAHASGPEELKQRPIYRKLLHQKVFTYALTIQQDKGLRNYRAETLL